MLEEYMEKSGTLVAAFCETHLNPSMKEAEISMENYSVFRADRKDRSKGGVVVYLRKEAAADAQLLTSGSNGTVEHVVVHSKAYNLVIINVYRPPSTPTCCFSPVINKIRECLAGFNGAMPSIVFCGDLNLPGTSWETGETTMGLRDDKTAVEILTRLQSDFFMTEVVNQPTRGSNCLDLCFTNSPDKFLNVETETTQLSDHMLILARTMFDCRKSPISAKDNKGSPLEQLNFFDKRINWDNIYQELAAINWEQEFINSNVIERYDKFYDILEQVCLKCVPRRRKRRRKVIPKDRRILMKKRGKILKKEQTHAQIQKLRSIEEALQKSHMEEEKREEANAVDMIKLNPKYFFNYVKRKGQVKTSIGPLLVGNRLTSDPEEICEDLRQQYESVFSTPAVEEDIPEINERNSRIPLMDEITVTEEDFITAVKEVRSNSAPGPDGIPAILLKKTISYLAKPLCILWNESLRQGEVPRKSKIGKITPIYKGGDKRRRKNYRPVSLTSHIIKLVERVIAKKIVQHLETENLYNDGQHGFRRGRSCLTQLLQHYQSILEWMSEGNDVDVIYLDFSKAFDKVDHRILLQKLKAIGIPEQLCKWTKSFLDNRKQFVAVDGSISSESDVISGVPQGTVLGPLLFLIYIADIDDDLQASKASSFADDTRILKPVSSVRDCEDLQGDLSRIYDWATNNNMCFNGDKFELLRYTLKGEPIPFQYLTADGRNIEPKSDVIDLGVHMANSGSFKKNIEELVKKAKERLGWIFRVFVTREAKPMLTLYRALVLPILEYCSQLWHPSEVGICRCLEAVQRSFTSRLAGMQQLNYWERLRELKLYSLERRRERYMAIYVWKIIVGLTPNFEGSREVKTQHSDRRGRTCKVPPVNRTAMTRIQTLQENSLPVLGVRLFNILPTETRNYNGNLNTLKSKVDKFLSRVPDQPLMPHYYQGSTTNSIIKQVEQMGVEELA